MCVMGFSCAAVLISAGVEAQSTISHFLLDGSTNTKPPNSTYVPGNVLEDGREGECWRVGKHAEEAEMLQLY